MSELEDFAWETYFNNGSTTCSATDVSKSAYFDDWANVELYYDFIVNVISYFFAKDHIECTDDYGEEHVKQFANGALAVAALKNGQVDCVVIDNEPAKAYVKANTGLEILETEYTVEDYAIAIAKNNTELFDKVNTALKALIEDGTVQSILDKYIKAD